MKNFQDARKSFWDAAKGLSNQENELSLNDKKFISRRWETILEGLDKLKMNPNRELKMQMLHELVVMEKRFGTFFDSTREMCNWFYRSDEKDREEIISIAGNFRTIVGMHLFLQTEENPGFLDLYQILFERAFELALDMDLRKHKKEITAMIVIIHELLEKIEIGRVCRINANDVEDIFVSIARHKRTEIFIKDVVETHLEIVKALKIRAAETGILELTIIMPSWDAILRATVQYGYKSYAESLHEIELNCPGCGAREALALSGYYNPISDFPSEEII